MRSWGGDARIVCEMFTLSAFDDKWKTVLPDTINLHFFSLEV